MVTHATNQTNNMQRYVVANRQQPGDGVSSFTCERYEHAGRYIPQTAQVIVDMGCNTGMGASVLRQAAPSARLIGIDIVPERLAEASKKFDEVHQAVLTSIPIESSSVDAITILEVIEHLDEKDVHGFLGEAYRILKPNGILIATTPNPDYLRLRLTGRSVLDDPSHFVEFKAKELARLLEQNNFTVSKMEGTGRISRYLGTWCPLLSLYGSYLIVGYKRAKTT